MAKYDTGSKRTLHLYARAWAEWVVTEQQVVLEAELSGEMQFVARATDVLLRVHDQQGKRYLVLTELQLRYDPRMPRRLAAYAYLWGNSRQNIFMMICSHWISPGSTNFVMWYSMQRLSE